MKIKISFNFLDDTVFSKLVSTSSLRMHCNWISQLQLHQFTNASKAVYVWEILVAGPEPSSKEPVLAVSTRWGQQGHIKCQLPFLNWYTDVLLLWWFRLLWHFAPLVCGQQKQIRHPQLLNWAFPTQGSVSDKIMEFSHARAWICD